MSITKTIAKHVQKVAPVAHPKKPAGAAQPAATTTAPPSPRKPPESVEAWYESGKSCFWCKNGKEQWQKFNSDELACMLKNRGYFGTREQGQACSEVESFLHRIRFWNSVDWAGELAGWQTGRHHIAGMDVLIIRGNKPVQPVRGNYPFIRRFLKTLLGNEQLPYFLGWLKGSLAALEEGYPFRPGQLVAFCGGVNSGKSFAQLLVTHLLGERQGDPTAFLLGNTDFTGDFFKAEHLFIEDKALKDFSHAKRRAFAANLKGLIVNQDQRVHPKGKDASLLPVGTRITLSCNDAPEALAILPALDSDVADKVIYFHCGEGDLPMRRDREMSRKTQFELFKAEMPAFVWWLKRWKIPEAIIDQGNRFTVGAYHNPAIIERLQDLTPEQRLLQLLEVLDLSWDMNNSIVGTAAEIEQWMRKKDTSNQLDRILTFAASMGQILARLAREGEERVKVIPGDGRKLKYAIFRDEL